MLIRRRGGPSIPSNITAMQGQVIGPPLGEIEITAGDCLYLNATRTATGDGVISGPVSIAGDVVSVSDGVNTAVVTVGGFDAANDVSVLAVETITSGKMRVGTPKSSVATTYSFGAETSTYSRGCAFFTHESALYLAVSNYSDGLFIFDCTDPAVPTLKASYTAGGYFHGGAVCVGDKLFAPGRDSGLFVFDVASLATGVLPAPRILPPPTQGLTTSANPKPTGLVYDATTDILYIADRVGGWGSIKNVSITSIESLAYSTTLRRASVSGTINMEVHRAETMTVGAKRLLILPSISTNILVIEDVSDATTPVLQSCIPASYMAHRNWDVKYAGFGNYVVVSQWNNSYLSTIGKTDYAGIAVYDLSEPESPTLCSRLTFPLEFFPIVKDSPPYDIFVIRGMAYVALGVGGLAQIDISDPYNPALIRITPVVSPITPDHGYTGVCVYRDVLAAVSSSWNDSGEIDGESSVVIMSAFDSADAPDSRLTFHPLGGTAHIVDDYFDYTPIWSGDGTKVFPSIDWPYVSEPPIIDGAKFFSISLTKTKKQYGIFRNIKNGIVNYNIKGSLSVEKLPPPNGIIYITFLSNKSADVGTSTTPFLQLIIKTEAVAGKYRVAVKYHNGSTTVNTSYSNVSILLDENVAYDFAISYSRSASGSVSFSIGSCGTITVSGDFSAAPAARFVSLWANRTDSTSDDTFIVSFRNRFSFNDSTVDMLRTENIWVAAGEYDLQYGLTVGSKKASIADLAVDGDYAFDGGNTHLYSIVSPLSVGVTAQKMPRNVSGVYFSDWAPFDGTLQPLTTESKFRLTRTVKSDGPLTANQIRKNVVEALR